MSAGNLCLVPGTALASSTQVITGVLAGEEDRDGIGRMMRTAMRYNVKINGACMLLFVARAGPVVSMFYKGDSSGMDVSVTGFRFYALCMFFLRCQSDIPQFLSEFRAEDGSLCYHDVRQFCMSRFNGTFPGQLIWDTGCLALLCDRGGTDFSCDAVAFSDEKQREKRI